MPIYEYICKSCGERFSLFQKMGAAESETACPKCGLKNAKKVMSSFCCSSGTGASSSFPSGGHGGG